MNTLDSMKFRNTAFLKDSKESQFGKPLLDFFSQETPFMKANYHEEKNSFHWQVEVPGLAKENLTIRIDRHSMLVSGQESKPGESKFTRTLFHHTFRVPSTANVDNAMATCRNGVLKISIAKMKPKHVHRIIRVQGENHRAAFTPLRSFWHSVKEQFQRLSSTAANTRIGIGKFFFRNLAW